MIVQILIIVFLAALVYSQYLEIVERYKRRKQSKFKDITCHRCENVSDELMDWIKSKQ